MDSDTYDHDECSYLNKRRKVMACKHSIVTNQKSALPPGAVMARKDIQRCCFCGMVRTQEWSPWRKPIHVEEVTQAESSRTIDAVGEGPLPEKQSTDCYTGKTEKQDEGA